MSEGKHLKKSAFTMIELIIVIVVAGILAAVMVPRMERDTLREATTQMVRHIQYTQHLAMIDDVYNATAGWEDRRWNVVTNATNNGYSIKSTANITAENLTGAAMDPATGTYINGLSGDAGDLSEYGNINITVNGSCAGKEMAFDSFGRPHYGKSGNVMTVKCIITVKESSKTMQIVVEPSTGYVHIL